MSLSSVSRVSNVSHWEENAPERMWGWEHACAYLAAKLAAEYASKYARGCWKRMLVIGVISLCAWMAGIESGLTKALTNHDCYVAVERACGRQRSKRGIRIQPALTDTL